MSKVSSNKHLSYKISQEKSFDDILKISRALSSQERLQILKYILNKSVNLMSISKDLGIPISSVSRHIDILSEAGLVIISYQPGLKGHAKFCAQAVLDIHFSLIGDNDEKKSNSVIAEMPVGLFSEINVSAPCGMCGLNSQLGPFDSPQVFFSPIRTQAECIWFNSGFVSYTFPVPTENKELFKRISFSMELCSDTIYYNNKWPSDITIKINDLEITTFTSPGNFGGKKGRYTPDYWPVTSSQFGQLKKFSVDRQGVYIDNEFIHNQITFDDLHLFDNNFVKLTLEVKKDAKHCGGLTLFGKHFGDFDQTILMKISQ